jgi:hypothetical protein
MTNHKYDKQQDVEQARKLLDDLRCPDGGCVFARHDGIARMVTNGGCRCVRLIADDQQRAGKLNRLLRHLVQIVNHEP